VLFVSAFGDRFCFAWLQRKCFAENLFDLKIPTQIASGYSECFFILHNHIADIL